MSEKEVVSLKSRLIEVVAEQMLDDIEQTLMHHGVHDPELVKDIRTDIVIVLGEVM